MNRRELLLVELAQLKSGTAKSNSSDSKKLIEWLRSWKPSELSEVVTIRRKPRNKKSSFGRLGPRQLTHKQLG